MNYFTFVPKILGGSLQVVFLFSSENKQTNPLPLKSQNIEPSLRLCNRSGQRRWLNLDFLNVFNILYSWIKQIADREK